MFIQCLTQGIEPNFIVPCLHIQFTVSFAQFLDFFTSCSRLRRRLAFPILILATSTSDAGSLSAQT